MKELKEGNQSECHSHKSVLLCDINIWPVGFFCFCYYVTHGQMEAHVVLSRGQHERPNCRRCKGTHEKGKLG